MFEACLLHILGNLLQSVNVRELLFGNGKPAEPIALVRPTPERGILLPEARDLIVSFPIVEGRGNGACKRTGQLVGLAV